MIKLLIVDDEIDLIDGIKSIIDWESHGVTICGEADNGASALELIGQLSPDIVLMDIRMPIMDGLQVLEHMHKENLETKCIMLSGYDDFYYAQKALTFRASDYLLKPCRPAEILESVLKVKGLLEQERSKNNMLENYRNLFYENIPVLREKLLREIINNKGLDTYNVEKKMNLYNIKNFQSKISTIVMHLNLQESSAAEYSDLDIESLKIAASDILDSTLPMEFTKELFQDDDNIVALISFEEYKQWEQLCNSVLITIKDNLKTFLHISVTIGIGGYVHDIKELWISYRQALSALEARFFIGEDTIISFDNISMENKGIVLYPINEDMEIINCLSTGNYIELKNKLENFFNEIYSSSQLKRSYLLNYCYALLGSIFKFCLDKNIDTEIVFGSGFSYYADLPKCDTALQLQESLFSILNKIVEKINENKNSNHLIRAAVEYIKEHYSEDISLETVAKQIYITPGYVSQLFKQEIGVNFLEYLHKHRIQKSKELFHNRFLRNYEVSVMVGYRDEKYFTQIFKKYTGMTPSQYKESIL
jgi:two-component system response regulator YesN